MKTSVRQFILVVFLFMVSSRAAEVSSPALPPIPSPIEDFRQLLRVTGEEREKLLAGWPEEKATVLRRKCDFYDALEESERERRLKMLELRWYMQPLMTNSTDRATALNAIPPEYRELVAKRLAEWEKLPEAVRKQYLENEMALHYFVRLQQTRGNAKPVLSAEDRKKVDVALASWRGMSNRERIRTSREFNRLFELPRDEREKTLHALSEPERKEMERTLEAFARLPADQRRVSIDSFEKLAAMEPAQRVEFFRNVQRWQAMTPKEREQWRSIVKNLPPLPPDPGPPIPHQAGPVSSNLVGN